MQKAKPSIMIGILLAQSAICTLVLFMIEKFI